MYYLSLNPHVQNKLQEEVDKVLNGELPTLENIKELKYCSNVIKETLRISPVVPWLLRQTHTDLIVDGILLPKGTTISVLIYALHHDTRFWDQPSMFIPERWEEEKN
uniref:Cytochrome P450 n=1 Tax=Arcella intermedia TaxID=1963864 RepID=A0A6B2LSC8_9EUKA